MFRRTFNRSQTPSKAVMNRPLLVLLSAGLLFPATGIGAGEAATPATIDPKLRDTTGQVSVIVQTEHAPGQPLLDRLDRIGDVANVYSVIDGLHMYLTAEELGELARVPGVERIDADEPLAWHLDTSRSAVGVGPQMWDQGIDGGGGTVAVLDTGIDQTHPSVQGKVAAAVVVREQAGATQTPASTDTDGHGTHVAGIVAGTGQGSQLLRTDNRRYAGMATGSQLISIDISNPFTTSSAIEGFDWVHENHETYDITVVQNSWGRKEVGEPYDDRDPTIRASNALVRDDGLLLVFSAANEGPEPSSLSLEAQNPNVLTVGAVDDSGSIAEFSSRGPVLLPEGGQAGWVKPDVVAPGVQIRSAKAGAATGSSFYVDLSGTSQAAPHVAGIAAMVRASAPDLGPLEVMELFRRAASDLGPQGPDPATGYGFTDAPRTLELALATKNGTLELPQQEMYTASGQLVLGPTGELSGVLGGTGAKTESASGTIPVKPRSTRLSLNVSWSSTVSGTPPPDLTVTLTRPDGETLRVPAQDGTASRTVSDPTPGSWMWELRAANEPGTGAAEYQLGASVTTPRSLDTLGQAGGGGGFFDSPSRQAQQYYEDLEQELGEYTLPALAAAALLAILLLVAIVKVIF